MSNYCFTGAGVVLAAGVFTVLAAFLWCFLVVLAVVAAAGLVAAGAAGAGAGVWANVKGMVASAKAKVRIVVFILFILPRGPCRPLTIPYCALREGNTIAPAGYADPRIRAYRG